MIWAVAFLCVILIAILGLGLFFIGAWMAAEDAVVVGLVTMVIGFVMTIITPVVFTVAVVYKMMTLPSP